MFKKLFMILAGVLFWSSLALGQTLYYQDSGTATLQWDIPAGYSVDHYNILVIRDSGEQTMYTSYTNQVQIQKVHSGRFAVQVQAVQSGTGSTSGWCSSNSSCGQLKEGPIGPWKLVFRPTPPYP